jgi:hypothetical protein
LHLKVDCLDCNAKGARDGKLHFDKTAYAIALNTLAGRAGIQQLPFGKSLDSGANFLVVLDGEKSGRILIAQDYYPYQVFGRPGSGETEIGYRRGFTPKLEPRGSFVEMVMETNRRHFGRDGTVYQPQRYSRSPLRFGSADPSSPSYDSLSEWYGDPKTSTITVRLSWGKLLITDPSSGQAWSGFDQQGHALTAGTLSMEVSVLALRPRGTDFHSFEVAQSLPALNGGNTITGPKAYAWRRWDKVKVEPYYKKAFYALQNEFRQEIGATTNAGGNAAGVGSSAAGH